MAFVYRCETKATYIPKSDSIGPGQYENNLELEQKSNAHAFNSTVQRINQSKDPQQHPGPGSYEVGGSFECQKVIFQSEEQEIKILEVPKPISVFRSTTVRFKDGKLDGPSPTTYFQDEQRKFHSAGHVNRNKKTNVLEQLVRDNKYISIPSIPSNIHAQGYTDNKDNQLELNQVDTSQDVGPGTYDFKSTFNNTRPRGVSWHKPNSQERKKEQKSAPGPGYYDVNSHLQPMYQMKPTTAFSSKQNRYSDLKFHSSKFNTGYIKKGLDNKQYSFHLSTNAGTTARDTDDDESEYSYIEDATPGPGYYENASTQQTISQFLNKSQHKGSLKTKTRRFQNKSQHTPGPGQYQLDIIPHKHKGSQPPFLSGNQRFLEDAKAKVPPIGTYNPPLTMEDNLKAKLIKAPLGSFGVNEIRFKDSSSPVPGPATYDIQKIEENIMKKKITETKGSASFVSHVPKIQELVMPTVSPSPGVYNIVQHTIANRVMQPVEDDPKLAVIKPGFGVGEKRWKYQDAIEEEEEDDIFLDRSIQQIGHPFQSKKKRKEPPAFMTKEERFSKSVPKYQGPGPSDYADGICPNWNKRTFNIIFAEI